MILGVTGGARDLRIPCRAARIRVVSTYLFPIIRNSSSNNTIPTRILPTIIILILSMVREEAVVAVVLVMVVVGMFLGRMVLWMARVRMVVVIRSSRKEGSHLRLG